MISTVSRRVLLTSSASALKARQAFHLRHLLSTSTTTSSFPSSSNNKDDSDKRRARSMHSSSRQEADATTVEAAPTTSVLKEEQTQTTTVSFPLLKRFIVTAEVTVSKIFPAGFGWQTASIVAAGNYGMATDTMSFAAMTGVGDAIGVFAGHMAYYSGKKALTGASSINLTQELHTGIWLGSAAFCSGTAWQPIVNALQGANLPFAQVVLGTWVGCATAFYVGLRVGRTILSGPLKYVNEPTYENSKADVSLSTAIGGATGFFVGTDVAYLPEQNFLINVVGIQPGTSDLMGACIAGQSTSLGFVAAQSTMNMIFPAGKSWTD